MIKKAIFLAALFSTNIFAQSVVAGFTGGAVTAKSIAQQAINDATLTLKVSAYQLTSQDIINLIVAAQKRGVAVAVLLDRTQSSGAAQRIFVQNNIDCYIDQKHKIMHHKFLIVDDRHVQTGSFNYSKNAETRNAENVLYLYDSPHIANQYSNEFERIKKTAIKCAG